MSWIIILSLTDISFTSSYVQRLEERISQLESLIPQESLDHLDTTQLLWQPDSASQSDKQPRSHEPIFQHSFHASGNGNQSGAAPIGPPAAHETNDLPASLPSVDTPLDASHLGVFGVLPWVNSQPYNITQNELFLEAPDLGSEMEQFLIQTYFHMTHSQYPILLKHQFLEWAESWSTSKENLPQSMRWKGFIVYMVFAIAFLMTKSRINGLIKAQELYTLATSRYLRYLHMSTDALIRAQGFLLLTVYALHMSSQENIITLSAGVVRFCVMLQLHLAEAEPEPLNSDVMVEIQHRRRVFWCAYAIDRAVCSSYDLPFSIPDKTITVPMFDNIDDDQLLGVASSSSSTSQLVGSDTPTSISPALHIFVSRKIESEIQEKVLDRDFIAYSEGAFAWRAEILEQLKEWNIRSGTLTRPSQKGYVSIRWPKMIYYYNIIMLYRPARSTAQGVSGDMCVQACCQALLLYRKLQMAREIAQPWLGLLTQFQIGITLLYCFFATPTSQWKASYKSADVPDAIRACTSTLAILAERWAESECIRDVFEILAREVPVGETWERPARISEAGRKGIEENWETMRRIVIHRPTLRMIDEIMKEDFVNIAEMNSDGGMYAAATPAPDAVTALFNGMDLQWDEIPNFDLIADIEGFSEENHLQL